MKKIFIYYSLTGNMDLVAEKLAEQGYELRKVVEKKKMPKTFFFMILAGGFRAGMKQKGKLINYDSNIEDYGEVVIGSPTWNGRLTPAINTVLRDTKLEGKDLKFVFTAGSGQAPKIIKQINKLYPNSKIIVLKEPKKYPDELNKLQDI